MTTDELDNLLNPVIKSISELRKKWEEQKAQGQERLSSKFWRFLPNNGVNSTFVGCFNGKMAKKGRATASLTSDRKKIMYYIQGSQSNISLPGGYRKD